MFRSLAKVPLDEFERNLKEIVNLVKDPASPCYSADTGVLLITPGPVQPERGAAHFAKLFGKSLPIERSLEHTEKYATAVKRVGKELEVPVADVWTALNDEADRIGGLDSLLSDGLHYTTEGYRVITEGELWPFAWHCPGRLGERADMSAANRGQTDYRFRAPSFTLGKTKAPVSRVAGHWYVQYDARLASPNRLM